MTALSQTLQTLIYPTFGIAICLVSRYLLGNDQTINGIGLGVMTTGIIAFTHGAYQDPPK